MKVLFCSPYLSNDDVLKGGINTWGRHIISYYNTEYKGDLSIIPVSFDRKVYNRKSNGALKKILLGLREFRKPVSEVVHYINNENIDVIHLCTSAGYGLFRDMLLVSIAKRKGVKAVIHLHFGRIPELALLNNWEWKLFRQVANRANLIVVMNRPTEDTLKSHGYNNIVYLPNPISQSILDKINQLKGNFVQVPRRILFAGHVIKTKGVYELVEACNQIQNIELRIVGRCSPEMKHELEHIAHDKDNGDWMHIIGEQSQDDLIKEYLQADLFVFPSYTEGFPNVILEAMASKCMVLSSNVGAIPEMLDIDYCPCGLCFNPQNKDEIVNAINKVIDDNDTKILLSQRANERVNMMYSMSKIWEQLVKIWE